MTDDTRYTRFEISIWYDENKDSIQLRSPDKGVKLVSTVRADPEGKRGHPNLFGQLAGILRKRGKPAPAIDTDATHASGFVTRWFGTNFDAALRVSQAFTKADIDTIEANGWLALDEIRQTLQDRLDAGDLDAFINQMKAIHQLER